MSTKTPTDPATIQAAMKEAYDLMREADPVSFIAINASYSGHPANDGKIKVFFDAAYVLSDDSQPRGRGPSAVEAAEKAIAALRAHDPLKEARAKLEAAGYAVISPA